MKWNVKKVFKYDKIFSPVAFEYLEWAANSNKKGKAQQLIKIAEDAEETYRKANNCINDSILNHVGYIENLEKKYKYIKTCQLDLYIKEEDNKMIAGPELSKRPPFIHQYPNRKCEKKEQNKKEKTYKDAANEVGEKLEEKNKAYGNSVNETKHILKIFLKKYRNKDGTYTIPEEALDIIARQSRIIDKQFRLFSNPKKDLMDEDPNKDIAGYSIIAYAEKQKEDNND